MYGHDICCQVSAISHRRAACLVLVREDMKNFIKETCRCQAPSVSIIEVIGCGDAVTVVRGRNWEYPFTPCLASVKWVTSESCWHRIFWQSFSDTPKRSKHFWAFSQITGMSGFHFFYFIFFLLLLFVVKITWFVGAVMGCLKKLRS